MMNFVDIRCSMDTFALHFYSY